MKYKVVYAVIGFVLVLGIVGGIAWLPYFKQLKGSVSREASDLNCNGRDTACVQSDKKIIAQKRLDEPVCTSDEDCSRLYSMNVSLAVKAIRDYTGIPDLQLTPVEKDGIPVYITYYCSDAHRCWAVDHRTHAVVVSS